MTRTDRLLALVEELRAGAPGSSSTRSLARRLKVDERVVERDVEDLREAGVPIKADTAGTGWFLDTVGTLPPVVLSPAEAVALATAVGRDGASPFAHSGRTALLKIISAMSMAESPEDRRLAERIRALILADGAPDVPAAAVVEEAVATRKVVRFAYAGRDGTRTEREVEPVAFVAGARDWHLIGWCRLRDAPRIFRIDRIRQAALLEEVAPPRDYSGATPHVTDLLAAALRVD
ncbi:helix-turn-helix transcriptional regulator [Actinoallomurus rhizosphaericola]|uniref:helix-turn-helix transcriptional regulator n=1 Tax=Actinoallomurus rhizosphaericola TaxID=2952536 RepID=UPI002090A5B9|nr:WYL domain-containing protein [Actinoallomurus rhizosphaericola]MCO5993622.1 WYL domain-containing protein [Actinoallomurus rhizosphaericola]